MKYGLHLAAAGALTSMYRQDVLANNLANMNTVGFKPDAVATLQLPAERVLDGHATPPKDMLERLGGVVQSAEPRPALRQGELIRGTGPLDLAIEGDGFFVLEGGAGPEDPIMTRDGRFTLDAAGQLVTAASGRPVLDENGASIRLDPSLETQVDESGAIRQDGDVVARLRLVGVAGAGDLEKVGDGMLRLRPGALLEPGAADGAVRQSMVESSAVDPISTMNSLMAAAKAANGNIRMMQFHDYLSGQAINVLGRV